MSEIVSNGRFASKQPSSRHSLSLAIRGAWGQVAVSATLITVLPALILLWAQVSGDATRSPLAMVLAFSACLLLILLGYTLLLKYPASITRLRQYLKDLAQDQLPDHVELPHDEDDINAIQQYLEKIVEQAEERIRLLSEKHEADLARERHLIMIESIGALCHHFGQPATSLGICIHYLKESPPPPQAAAILADAQTAFDEMTRILDRLRDLSYYQAEPYLAADPNGPHIIRLDLDSGAGKPQERAG